MGNKAVRLDVNGKTLTIDDIEYKITPGLEALIVLIVLHDLRNLTVVIIKHVNRSLYIPKLNQSRLGQVLLDHILHGSRSICSRKWLYLEKG